MMNSYLKISVIPLLLLPAAPTAFAEFVLNHDFSAGDDGSWIHTGYWGSSIVSDGPGGDDDYAEFSGWGNSTGGWSNGAIWQNTGSTFAADTEYTLSVDWRDPSENIGDIMILLIDVTDAWADVAWAFPTGPVDPVTWTNSTLTFDTSTNPALVGHNIGVGVRLTTDVVGTWVHVNNVSVTSEIDINVDVDVDPNQTVLDIDPDFFGACLMYWSETDADMADGVIEQHLTDMPIKFLRFPGGTDSDGYLWDVHLLYDNTRWPFEDGPHTMDTDEFMTLCRNIDAEPVICVNTELAFFQTQQQAIDLAADWVTYCNVTNNYNVKYWEIGNEPFWKTRFTAIEYANLLTSMAVAMKAVDPNILIVAAGTVTTWEVGVKEQIPPADWPQAQAYEYLYEQTLDSYYMNQIAALRTVTDGTPWWEQVLDNAGGSIDAISIHWYFNPGSLPVMTQTINNLRNYCRQQVPGKELPIIVTEWNEYRNPGVPSTGLVRALELAESAGRLLDGGIQKVALWPLRTNGWYPEQRLLERENNNSPTVNYNVLQLFASYIGTQKISSTSSSSNIYNFASLTETGQASVVLINRSSNSCNVDLAVNGYQQGAVEVKLLRSAGDPSSNNTVLDRVSTPVVGDTLEISMPGYSMLQVTYSCVNSGACDFGDLIAMASAWLTNDGQWDIAPLPEGDGAVNLLDFTILAEHWDPPEP